MAWTDRIALAGMAAILLTAPAFGQSSGQPMTSNDWLRDMDGRRPATASGWRPSDGVPPDATRRRPAPRPGAVPGAAPVGTPQTGRDATLATTGAPPQVTVSRLGQGNPDALGTISAKAAVLPSDLWAGTTAETAADLIAAADPRLPATRGVLRAILTAQLDPPARETAPEGALFLARVDKLIAMGDLPAARALLQAAGPGDTGRFARSVQLDLLTGDARQSCSTLTRQPGLLRDLATRTYCLAINGDWGAAALTLRAGESMGAIEPATAALLTRFLDDSYADQPDDLDVPDPITPLAFRLHDAVGQPLPTAPLPLVYAWADLDPNGGWKARLDAAERLARAGAIPPTLLATIYGEQKPAASGGVWDRAAGLQMLIRALDTGDTMALDTVLPGLLARFAEAGLAQALADMVAARLPESPTAGGAAQAALRLRLLAGLPVTPPPGTTTFDKWLSEFGRSGIKAGAPENDPTGIAATLVDAFAKGATADPSVPAGPAFLSTLADVDAGLDGDTRRAAPAIAQLRALGQERAARQAVVELLLLPQLDPTAR